jgi:hypothetical protein
MMVLLLSMAKKLPLETYWWYFPLYNFRNPLKDINLGFGALLRFESLPRQVRKEFLIHWEQQHAINNEYIQSKRGYIGSKKSCAILSLEVKESIWDAAIDISFKAAKSSVSILSFLYLTHFPVEEGKFISGEIVAGGRRVISGSSGEYYPRRSLDICEYKSEHEKEISKLTEILKNPKSEIDRRIKSALTTFEIQTSVPDQNVKFVLLVTCLESLLMGKSDRDYLGARLSEKSAFLFPNDREVMYNRVKKAYDKRSAFIHGSEKTVKQIDLNEMQATVVSIVRQLIDLKENGYDNMEKVDAFIKKLKFRN